MLNGFSRKETLKNSSLLSSSFLFYSERTIRTTKYKILEKFFKLHDTFLYFIIFYSDFVIVIFYDAIRDFIHDQREPRKKKLLLCSEALRKLNWKRSDKMLRCFFCCFLFHTYDIIISSTLSVQICLLCYFLLSHFLVALNT